MGLRVANPLGAHPQQFGGGADTQGALAGEHGCVEDVSSAGTWWTTPAVDEAHEHLTGLGYEVIVFHATGSGGRAMEVLAESGLLTGVLDLTTTELADDLVGGVLSAGPRRLEAGGRRGIPQVVSVGALDMVNFGPRESVPDRFEDRRLYVHNPTVTLMRTTPAEMATLGARIAEKLARASEETALEQAPDYRLLAPGTVPTWLQDIE